MAFKVKFYDARKPTDSYFPEMLIHSCLRVFILLHPLVFGQAPA